MGILNSSHHRVVSLRVLGTTIFIIHLCLSLMFMIAKVRYGGTFPYSFAENFLQNEQQIVDFKRIVRNKKKVIKRFGRKFMFTCLFVCLLLCRFLQVTSVDALWSLTSLRKLEISVELQKEGV